MRRLRDHINNLDDSDIEQWIIYESHGFGVMEAPQYDGKTLQVFEGTEFEAYVIAEGLNTTINGTMSKRSSWEDPTIRYKKAP